MNTILDQIKKDIDELSNTKRIFVEKCEYIDYDLKDIDGNDAICVYIKQDKNDILLLFNTDRYNELSELYPKLKEIPTPSSYDWERWINFQLKPQFNPSHNILDYKFNSWMGIYTNYFGKTNRRE